MNKIDTSNITDPSRLQPFSGKSLDFVQNNVVRLGQYLYIALKGSTYSPSGSYSGAAIYGANISGSVIEDGIVLDLFSGELRDFTGANTAGYVNPPRVIEDNSYDGTIDPITFSDGSSFSVHQLRKWKIADVASGGFLYSALLILNEEWQPATLLNSFAGTLYYKRDLRNSTLYIRGTVTRATAPIGNTVVFTLPAAYRPENNQYNVVMYTSNAGSIISELGTNQSTGDVILTNVAGATTVVININIALRLD